MPAIPETETPTVAAIYKHYETKRDKPRRYVGASVIGGECERAIWYGFRWAGQENFSGRMLRLFESGHLEEIRVIHNLRAIGVAVHNVDEATGDQFGVSALGGHFRGHLDAVALGLPEAPKTWHLLEMKTAKAKLFATLKTKGIKDWNAKYYAQVQVYMHLNGLERCMFIVVCKDTDEIYSERINYEKADAERYIARAERIIRADSPPERIANDPSDFRCKFCSHAERCHGAGESAAVPCNVNCRTCCHSTPIIAEGDAGRWNCEKHERDLSESEQEAGCEKHRFIPGLISFATPTDSDGDWIEYELPSDGTKFVNGQGNGRYTSTELATAPKSALSLPVLQAFKQQCGAVVVPDDKLPF